MSYVFQRTMYYKRDGKPYVGDGTPFSDLFEWARDFELTDRAVKQETLWWGARLSTVWLGLDHSFLQGPPLIFESMIFYRERGDIECIRYSTEKEAMEGHEALKRIYSRLRMAIPVLFVYWKDKVFEMNEKIREWRG